MKISYKRISYKEIFNRLSGDLSTIQVLTGPRQVGKTTLIKQVLDDIQQPWHYASADGPAINSETWVAQQWEIARVYANDRSNQTRSAILVLDEIQKIQGWSEIIKKLWDRDIDVDNSVKVVLLGSSPLLLKKGLDESLAGRFEIIYLTHWSFKEMQEAYGWTVEQYIYFGGYPKSAELIHDEVRWRDYILESLIETTISRDILLTARIDKPILLRRLFELGCAYAGQVLSYNKMLGQLDNAGNTTTLAHYLELLSGIGMVKGLDKYSGSKVRRKGSSPKLAVFNTAIISAQQFTTFSEAQTDRVFWGRLVESAVGAHLVNTALSKRLTISYWRDGNAEVDYILERGARMIGLEVKSGLKKGTTAGMHLLKQRYNPSKVLLVGGEGISLETFFLSDVLSWL